MASGTGGTPPRWWPDSPARLTDLSVCPACFSRLGGPYCRACGLDLGDPDTARALLRAGVDVVDAENRRQDVIAAARAAQREREAAEHGSWAPAPSASPAAPAPPPVPAGPVEGAPAPSEDLARPVPLGPSARRRSGVQVLLLTAGIVLVSVTAIFFLFVAYAIASLEMRSVLTVLVSAGVAAGAWVLRRRRLTSTAEGVGVLAVVLLCLDVWIIRANGLFWTASSPPWAYTAVAMGILAALLAGASTCTGVRSFRLSAVALAQVTAYSLGVALFPSGAVVSRMWAGATVLALACLVWPLFRSTSAERAVVRVATVFSWAASLPLAAAAWPSFRFGSTAAFAVTAAVFLAHLWVPARADHDRPAGPAPAVDPQRPGAWRTVAAVGFGLAITGVAVSPASGAPSLADALRLPVILLAAAAVLVSAAAWLTRGAARGRGMAVSAWVVLCAVIVAAFPGLGLGLVDLVARLTRGTFSLEPFAVPVPTFPQVEGVAAIAMAAVTIAGLCSLPLLGLWRRLGWAPIASAGPAIVFVGTSAGSAAALVAALAVVAAASLALDILARPRRGRRIVLTLHTVTGSIGLVAAGRTSAALWPVVIVVALAVVAVLRATSARTIRPRLRAVLGPMLTGLLAAIALFGARETAVWAGALAWSTSSAVVAFTTAAVAAIAVGVVPLIRRLPTSDGSVVASIAAVPAVLGVAELASDGDRSALYPIALALVLAAETAWQLVPSARERVARYVTAVLTPPTSALLAVEIWRGLDTGVWGGAELVTVCVAVVLAAVAPVLFRRTSGERRRSHPARLGWDAALALTTIVTVPAALTTSEFGPLTLLLLALLPLLFSAGEGDIVTGSSPRRHLAWVALPIGVSALWLALARADVRIVEWYSLPVAAVLIGVLLLVLVRTPLPADRPSGRNMLLLSALIAAFGPTAVAAVYGTPVRLLCLLVVAGAVGIAGSLSRGAVRGVLVPLWAACVSLSALAVAVVGRVLAGSDTVVAPELWLVPASAIVVAAGVAWLHRHHRPRLLGVIVIAGGCLVLGLPFTSVVVSDGASPYRVLLVGALLSLWFVAASTRRSPAYATSVRVAAVVGGGFLVIAAVTVPVLPVEAATAPLALGLIAGGLFRLHESPPSRSWPHLGPGLALLLLPSLSFDLGETTIVRVVSLGVVALAVLLWGVIAHLQAPTVVGAGVVIAHGFAQIWPWVSSVYASLPWWLWVGLGGVGLIAFAAGYERRIRDARTVVRAVAELR